MEAVLSPLSNTLGETQEHLLMAGRRAQLPSELLEQVRLGEMPQVMTQPVREEAVNDAGLERNAAAGERGEHASGNPTRLAHVTGS